MKQNNFEKYNLIYDNLKSKARLDSKTALIIKKNDIENENQHFLENKKKLY